MKIIRNIIIIILLINGSILFSHPVVKDLDIEEFMGRWYVFSYIPNWIEEGATNAFDDYVLNDDGTIGITYNAIKDGKNRTIKQKGKIIDKNIPARWEIQFIKPFIPFYRAPYEVILLDENYDYMVVGYPDNKFGWIMSRTIKLDNDIYDQILDILYKDFGYDINEFQKVIHDN
tara:strand:- start:1578 stop:2099 length:522 start_codon:yes stop_codon:yes gene_type:complete